ncbi:MAG: (Fe-S)-binding protein [Rhodospirillales bacterium]|nr:(Fe-S)-binding protein [Rhodospirillales bacterium]
MPTEIVLRLLVIALALAWSAYRFGRLARPLLAAPAEPRLKPVGPRIWGVVVNVLGHARLLRKPYSGLLHAMMFSGFLFLLTAVLQVFGSGVAPPLTLSAIGGETWIALGQDVFAVLLLVAVAMAALQRVVWKPARFAGSNARDAAIILSLVVAVVIGMLLQNAFRIVAGGDPSAPWRPVSSLVAAWLTMLGLGGAVAPAGATAFAWLHMLAILAFLVYIPGSKHLHMLVGIPNIFARNLAPPGRLATPDLTQPRLGLSDIGQLGRKQVLDLFACTECGRCQEMCPAYAAGKPLSPKLLIMNLRDHLLETQGIGGHRAGLGGSLIGGAVGEETIWSCTTCRACMEACPLFIEHVPKIVDLRRHLAMEAGRLPDGIAGAMLSIEQRGHPWAGTPFSRLDWCRDLGVRVLAPGEATDVLLWVGCTAALDSRAQKVARALVRLLQAANVDFAILGDAETCTGDAARRTGNDYQFQMQAEANVATLNARHFARIVTICPHCLNTLKNEYGNFGGVFEVIHHSQLLSELIASGRLPQRPGGESGPGAIAFHDPCYLGRYNGEYQAPRTVAAATGAAVVEMERSHERSFCCGGGGGRAFAVEPPDQRINTVRARQARATGAPVVATACPFCLLMLEDGSKAAARAEGNEARPQQVRDIAEILDAALHGSDGAAPPAP